MATSFASRLFGCYACALCNVLQAVDSFQLYAHVGFQWISVHKHGVMSSCDFRRCVSWGLCIFNLFVCILMIWKDRRCEYFCDKNRWKFWIWECRWIYVHLCIKKSFFTVFISIIVDSIWSLKTKFSLIFFFLNAYWLLFLFYFLTGISRLEKFCKITEYEKWYSWESFHFAFKITTWHLPLARFGEEGWKIFRLS